MHGRPTRSPRLRPSRCRPCVASRQTKAKAGTSPRTTRASRCTPVSICMQTTGRAWLTCAVMALLRGSRRSGSRALPDAKPAYRMKRRLGDGREVLIIEPRELLRRLATLVPPPRAHLVRYHGVFGPASKWRKEIVPTPSPSTCPAYAPCASDAPDTSHPPPATKPFRPLDSRIPCSELLLRVFREDILACPCGGRRKVIAFIDDKPVIERILRHLG